MSLPQTVTIVGAGPVGCLLAIILRQRGISVEVYEQRPDLRKIKVGHGRSINLVLTARGLKALDLVGLKETALAMTVPVLGRMMHSLTGELNYQPYGLDESECNYAISRDQLNQALLDAAEAAGAKIHFEYTLQKVCIDQDQLYFQGRDEPLHFELLFGCDGSPSVVRQQLGQQGVIEEQREMMAWGYKELRFPLQDGRRSGLAEHALHIWPRSDHFLMALANLDGSFTGTAYLPLKGPESFEILREPELIRAFFEKYYPDAIPLLGDFVQEFLENPIGNLGTVWADPWHFEDRYLLVGDAAHGIVPFFGQGLNAGFEDCTFLFHALNEGRDLASIFKEYSRARKPNGDAIARMSLENFVEMGDKVGDPNFLLQKQVEARLEEAFPELYRSRYAMVMYSHIPYAQAFERGERQRALLAKITAGISCADELDLIKARQLLLQSQESPG